MSTFVQTHFLPSLPDHLSKCKSTTTARGDREVINISSDSDNATSACPFIKKHRLLSPLSVQPLFSQPIIKQEVSEGFGTFSSNEKMFWLRRWEIWKKLLNSTVDAWMLNPALDGKMKLMRVCKGKTLFSLGMKCSGGLGLQRREEKSWKPVWTVWLNRKVRQVSFRARSIESTATIMYLRDFRESRESSWIRFLNKGKPVSA
ncbi:hypothetical protein BT69DRAFT_1304490 [Atractiella rhizophila]|nr:hypothetical protein BT69DRAFT_1304490 [Atractiella rhizophila]